VPDDILEFHDSNIPIPWMPTAAPAGSGRPRPRLPGDGGGDRVGAHGDARGGLPVNRSRASPTGNQHLIADAGLIEISP
jgi:hypothetical protein